MCLGMLKRGNIESFENGTLFSLEHVRIKIVLKNAPIVLELTVSLSYNKVNCEATKWC